MKQHIQTSLYMPIHKFNLGLFLFFFSFNISAQDSLTPPSPPEFIHPYHKHTISVGCGMPLAFGYNSKDSNGYYMLGAEPRVSYFFADFMSVNVSYMQTKLQTYGVDTALVMKRATGSVSVRRYMGEKRRFFADISFTSGYLYSYTKYDEPIETIAYKIGYGIGGSWVIHKYLGPLNNKLAFEIYTRKYISLIKKNYRGYPMLTGDVGLLALHYYFARTPKIHSAE